MNRIPPILCCTIILIIFCTACKVEKYSYWEKVKDPMEIRELSSRLEKVYYCFIGHFSNREQAQTTTSLLYQEQEIIAVPIWEKRKQEYWFYMGRFKANFKEQALEEGIFQLKRLNRDTLSLQFFEIPEAPNYTTEWMEEQPFKLLTPSDLYPVEDCFSYIVDYGINQYRIVAGKYHCPHTLSHQIHYVDFEGIITPYTHSYQSAFYDENQQLILDYKRPKDLKFKRLLRTENSL
ncbi:MAG: CpcT/CpeT family chromophore lyase [Saprospiraceae bacterium]|nr:CpcT/CpeT family chromophore lyase [Saprospiraceae bacterium]